MVAVFGSLLWPIRRIVFRVEKQTTVPGGGHCSALCSLDAFAMLQSTEGRLAVLQSTRLRVSFNGAAEHIA